MGQPVFGIPSTNKRGRGGGFGGAGARARGRFVKRPNALAPDDGDRAAANSQDEKFAAIALGDTIDEKFGFAKFESGPRRQGWLVNMHSTLLQDSVYPTGRAAVDFYFLEDGGTSFKVTIPYEPYFLVAVKVGHEAEVEEHLRRRFEGVLRDTSRLTKEDLRMPNHLTGYRRTFIRLSFGSSGDLFEAKRVLMPIVERNKKNLDAMDVYNEVVAAQLMYDDQEDNTARSDPTDAIIDLREHDVPYHVRVTIDLDIRIGKWYDVTAKHGTIFLSVVENRLTRADPVVMAWDIETTKSPLKFPDAAIDQIMMISYMIDGEGFLITNREIVSQDIDDFDYTPKAEFKGPFTILNEKDERALIERFFEHIQDARPTVMATYNGDFFDWPFVETRARIHGIDMYEQIGFRKNAEDVYESRYCAHMDCFAWVKRDSYLPQGSQGLKAVTTAKLGYDPIELDPELMTIYAAEKPQILSQYSVSDAVATYYLYMKYCHPFIFSLCNIIPLNPDDVLRKGTGTLCEMLLMVKAYQEEIVLPNKHIDEPERFYEGHLLDSETYVGGHVESLEAGVFRSDLPEKFNVDPIAVQQLIDDLDHALRFSIEVEAGKKFEDIVNYDDIKQEIVERLVELRDRPVRQDCPKIYHLDVASMYPNIMTTNRLQPDSMMDESTCATCDFNRPGKTCDKRMKWSWRGEYYPTKMDEYNMIKQTLLGDTFPPRFPGGRPRSFDELPNADQMTQVTKRLGDYSRKVYHKLKETKTVERETIVCQRENPFYVNTVKSFRDRRYDYKGHQKTWKKNVEKLVEAGKTAAEVEEAKKMVVLYDSLQLAHKVILNSFYGYVMRKGSRWYSMEMAGVTCLTGATIIQLARQLVEKLGRPLELDTDGIWCILPDTFPENFAFKLKDGKPLHISYPCVMLNHLVHAKFTNHEYEELTDTNSFKYAKHSENSIFFEVDGPYKAMILPTSKEEGKNLKKRYAVFNHDGSLAELKGFELKRRGELKLIKVFQNQVFKVFLDGATLEECYAAVGRIADKWLDVLYSKGTTLADEELIDLVCENRSMSKTVAEYGSLKSTSISTAKRLAEFLGDQMIKDKGLACKYIISAEPRSLPVTERAVPIAIFSAEDSIKRHFLRRWLKDPALNTFDIRNILDWNYYLERFGSVIQKLITMPAAMQKILNPVPRVAHPDWLNKQLAAALNPFKQSSMANFITRTTVEPQLRENPNAANVPRPIERTGLKRKQDDREALEEAEALKPLLLDEYEGMVENDEGVQVSGYPIWLQHQKRKWRAQANARARRRKLLGGASQPGAASTRGVLGQLQLKAAERVSSDVYHIVQLEETKEAGMLKAWAVIGGSLSAIKVNVPRQFYVNFRDDKLPEVDIAGCEIERASVKLPNGATAKNAFRLSMSESVYRDSLDKVASIATHRSIEGIYERQLPSTARAIMGMGTTCSFSDLKAGALARSMASGFQVQSLPMSELAAPTYLADIQFDYIFVAHATAGQRDVAIVVSPSQQAAQLVCYDPQRDVQSGGWHLDKTYRELCSAAVHTTVPFEYASAITCTTVVVHNEAKYIKAVSEAVRGFRTALSNSSLAIVSSEKATTLRQRIPALSELPVMQMPAVSTVAAGLDWQSSLVKSLLTRYFDLATWIRDREQLARYGKVPLCNIVGEDATIVLDIAMARQLKSQDILLWWQSGSPLPSRGGREVDDIAKALESVDPVQIKTSGAFDTVCIELEVRNLIVSTMLNSALINELEGSAADDAFAENESGGDMQDKDFLSPSITCFKALLKSWWQEATGTTRTAEADLMISQATRWIQSPASSMYDKNLDLYSQRVTNKAFLQLLAEFRRVGSKVVFGTVDRLLIQTTKPHVGNAHAYANYIVHAIRSKPLFHFIDMQIVEYWDYLLWLDEFNYGGYCTREVTAESEQEMSVAMHWNLKSYLPEVLAPVFEDWVLEYMAEMYQVKRKAGEFTLTQRVATDGDEKDRDISAVVATISEPILKQIEQLVIKYNRWRLRNDDNGDSSYDDTFVRPDRPGNHLRNEHPVLSLVKFLCQVFALVPEGQTANRILRRDLLAIVDTKEFSPAGKFEDPARAFALPRLPCRSCGGGRDIQLGRDGNLAVRVADPSTGKVSHDWFCPLCGGPVDALVVQELLVDQLVRLLAAFQAQDLRCAGKCKALMTTDMQKHCGCAGTWQATLKAKDVQEQIKVLRSIGKYYDFGLLNGAIEEMAVA